MKRSTFTLPIRRLAAVAAVILVTLRAAGDARASLAECIDATCRITAGDGSRGTGCCFERSGGQVFILTAAHVVGNSPAVECEFWRRGHISRRLTARVLRRSPAADAALLALPETAFGGLLPRVVPLAPRDYVVTPGETLASVGCAGGSWSTGWKGHALGYRGGDLHFVPTPADGRSGSAIFNAQGTVLVGLLRARTTDGASGIATSLQTLYAAFDQSRKLKAESRREEAGNRGSAFSFPLSALTQCPGGACPTAPWRLSPYRYRQDLQEQGQNQRIGRLENAWPTMPAPPAAAPIDLAPLGQKLDRIGAGQEKIAELLIEIRGKAESRKPKAVEAVGEVGAEIEAVRQESGRLRQAVETLVGDRETLRQRFEDRLEKVKQELGEDADRRQVARAYAKDFVQEKLGDGTLGLTTGKLLGGALGLSGPLALAIGGGLWLVSRRLGRKIETGDPLLVQRLFERIKDSESGKQKQ